MYVAGSLLHIWCVVRRDEVKVGRMRKPPAMFEEYTYKALEKLGLDSSKVSYFTHCCMYGCVSGGVGDGDGDCGGDGDCVSDGDCV